MRFSVLQETGATVAPRAAAVRRFAIDNDKVKGT
jgi:hypothetical protein